MALTIANFVFVKMSNDQCGQPKTALFMTLVTSTLLVYQRPTVSPPEFKFHKYHENNTCNIP